MSNFLITGITLSLILLACRKGNEMQDVTSKTTAGASSKAASENPGAAGYVYTLSNQTSGNSVISFSRSTNGTLTMTGSVATGGTGAGLGSCLFIQAL